MRVMRTLQILNLMEGLAEIRSTGHLDIETTQETNLSRLRGRLPNISPDGLKGIRR